MAELTPYQRDVLIRTALGEARGEGAEGMADVVQVILNRANSGKFPSDPARVALQPKQFSTWNAGEGGNNPQQFSPNSAEYKRAAEVVDLVASGGRPDPTDGALYYHAKSITPYWAASKDTNGTITRNGHVFYPQHPVPPGDIPTVATLLSVTRNPPAPVTSSPDLRMMRGATMPSQLIPGTFASLPSSTKRFTGAADLKAQDVRDATPRLQSNGSVLNPADYVFGKDLDYASAGKLPSLPQSINTPRTTKQMADIYKGGGPTRPVAPLPVSVPAVPPISKPSTRTALAPTRLPTLAPAPAPKPRAPTPSPATMSNDMRMMRSANNMLPRSAAPVPQTQSIQMASTRVAPSSPQAEQAAEQAALRMRTAMGPVAPKAPSVPAYSGPRVDVGMQEALLRQQAAKYPERLPSEPLMVAKPTMPAVTYDPRVSVAQTTGQVNPQGLQVATALDTRKMPPLPIARPPMGIGGPVATPQQVAGAKIPPTPMPRLERPGIFGNPMLGSFKVPLPGMLGHLQDFTAAMNNASGPFNNGADNLLYNTMRGGDFNAPGAATGQAGGFLFAPNPNGGPMINVGRVDPNISAAEDYARRNAGNGGPDNAYTRTKRNSTSNYGGAEPITGF